MCRSCIPCCMMQRKRLHYTTNEMNDDKSECTYGIIMIPEDVRWRFRRIFNNAC